MFILQESVFSLQQPALGEIAHEVGSAVGPGSGFVGWDDTVHQGAEFRRGNGYEVTGLVDEAAAGQH